MKPTEYGLMIDIEDLEKILEKAKQNAKYNDKESVLYFTKNQVIQYSNYAECNPTYWR